MMGAEHHPTNGQGLEPRGGGGRNWRGHRVVAPDGEGTEMYHMHSSGNSIEEHRMLSAAAKRIVQLNQALEESHANNKKMERFYKEKMAKLHKAQMYSVDRMGKRIDVLEAELASRTVELTRTQQELHKAVEKVVELQQQIANMQPPTTPTTVAASLFGGIQITGGGNTITRAQEPAAVSDHRNKEPNMKRRNNTHAEEERSYPSSAGSESDFVQKKSSHKKRCKVLESNWDHDASVIVPDSFMTAVDDASSTRSPRRRPVVVGEDQHPAKKDGGLSRFFQFGQRGGQPRGDADMVDIATKPTEYTARPNVIEDFYDICSADGSVPDTIMVAGR